MSMSPLKKVSQRYADIENKNLESSSPDNNHDDELVIHTENSKETRRIDLFKNRKNSERKSFFNSKETSRRSNGFEENELKSSGYLSKRKSSASD